MHHHSTCLSASLFAKSTRTNVIATQVSLHYLISFTHESYGRATSLSNLTSKFAPAAADPERAVARLRGTVAQGTANETVFSLNDDDRANATFVILCRNSDLGGTIQSIREIEDRFNWRYRYPYVLLNEEEFTEEFKKCGLSRFFYVYVLSAMHLGAYRF